MENAECKSQMLNEYTHMEKKKERKDNTVLETILHKILWMKKNIVTNFSEP